MALVKWKKRDIYDPWTALESLQSEINNLFDWERVPGSTGLFDRSLSPAIDVIEDANGFQITCELPGLDQKDLEISIASNVLTIKGQKKDHREEKKGKYYRKESWSGSFQRTLPFATPVDADRISAELKDGILRLQLPKKEEAKPKQISVKIN